MTNAEKKAELWDKHSNRQKVLGMTYTTMYIDDFPEAIDEYDAYLRGEIALTVDPNNVIDEYHPYWWLIQAIRTAGKEKV